MKNKTLWIVGGVVVLLIIWGISVYNGLVKAQVGVEQEWSNVETQYQRRADLIGNLVATVKGYAEHEKSTLTDVITARAAATQTKIDAQNLTPEKMKEFQAAQGELSSALGRLLVTIERYPDLKANQNFLELQAQLEGTENRIQVVRRQYNTVAGEFNKKVRVFPTNIIAGFFGITAKPFFEADEASSKAPKVEF